MATPCHTPTPNAISQVYSSSESSRSLSQTSISVEQIETSFNTTIDALCDLQTDSEANLECYQPKTLDKTKVKGVSKCTKGKGKIVLGLNNSIKQ
jgi:hypothetical protein